MAAFGPGPRAVNRAHPLCVGLLAWWLPTRERYGTPRLYDAVGGNHFDLAVAGHDVGVYGPARSTTRSDPLVGSATKQPGAWGASDPFTLAAWAEWGNGTNQCLHLGSTASDAARVYNFAGTNPRFELILTSPGTVQVNCNAGFTTTRGTPQLLTGTWDAAGNLALYVNERAAATATTTSRVMRTDPGNAAFAFGGDALGLFTAGWFWNRVLSPGEITLLNREARAGYPGMRPRASRGFGPASSARLFRRTLYGKAGSRGVM